MANITRIKAKDPRKPKNADAEELRKPKTTEVVEANNPAHEKPWNEDELPPEDNEDNEDTEDTDDEDEKLTRKEKKAAKKAARQEKKALKAEKKAERKANKTKKPMSKPVRIITWPFRMIAKPFITFGRYLRDSWREIRQVRWPSRAATWKMVFAVFIYSALLIALIMLLDALFTWLFNIILN